MLEVRSLWITDVESCDLKVVGKDLALALKIHGFDLEHFYVECTPDNATLVLWS